MASESSTNAQSLWVGKSRSSGGFVVYDPAMQRVNRLDTIYLFDVDHDEIKSYDRVNARKLFAKTQSSEAVQNITEVYRKWQARMERQKTRKQSQNKPARRTHCWQCGVNLNSRLDHVCKKCGWIQCECGGCGCNYPQWDWE